MPNPGPWVPGAKSRSPKPGTWYLRLDKDIYQKCVNQIFLISSNFCPKCQVPSAKPQTPKFWVLGLGTWHSGFGVWHLALGTKIWGDQKNLIYTFLIDIFVQSQISSPEFQVLGFRTWHLALRVWGLAQWNFTFISLSFRLQVSGYPEFRWYLLWISSFKFWVSGLGDSMIKLYKSPSAEFWNPKPGPQHLVFGDFSYLQNVVYWIFNIQFWQLILGTQYLVICVIYKMLYSGFQVLAPGTRHSELGTQSPEFNIQYLFPETLYLVISSLYKIPRTQYLLPRSWYLLSGTWYSILSI
jgi:hypothetical protein